MKKKLVKKKPTVKKKAPRKKFSHSVRSEYLNSLYGPPFWEKVPKAVKMLRAFKKKHPFDAIAFTGSSGAGFAYPLSYLMKVPLICVRKKENSHYRNKIEGSISAKRYVIVDDFIFSGSTIEKIIKTIDKEVPSKPHCVGILLYAGSIKERDWNDDIPVMSMPYS